MVDRSIRACPMRSHVDPRLPRFSAGATAGVLAVALLVAEPVRPLAIGLLASQVAIFAFTAFVSFHWSIWAQIYARLIWPRLAPPSALDDARPHRFGQLLGLVLSTAAMATFMWGVDGIGYVLTAVVAAIATLTAATGWCPGCQVYSLLRRT